MIAASPTISRESKEHVLETKEGNHLMFTEDTKKREMEGKLMDMSQIQFSLVASQQRNNLHVVYFIGSFVVRFRHLFPTFLLYSRGRGQINYSPIFHSLPFETD